MPNKMLRKLRATALGFCPKDLEVYTIVQQEDNKPVVLRTSTSVSPVRLDRLYPRLKLVDPLPDSLLRED